MKGLFSSPEIAILCYLNKNLSNVKFWKAVEFNSLMNQMYNLRHIHNKQKVNFFMLWQQKI